MNKWFKLGAVAATLFLGACSTSTSTTTSKDTVSQAQKNWDAIEKSGKIKVATAGTLYPQSFHTDKDNSLTGYDVEIVKEVAKRLNLEVDFTEMGVDGMLTALDSGQVDIANYSIEEGSKFVDKYLRTEPHKYSFTSMVVPESDNSGIYSWADVKGKKAAGAASTNYMKIAKKLGAELVIYDNVTNDVYMSDLVNGRTDVIINDYYLQKIAVAFGKDTFPIKINEDVYANPYSASFSIKLGNEVIQQKFNEALKSMKEDGTLTEISKTFFAGEDVTQPKDLKLEKIDFSDVE